MDKIKDVFTGEGIDFALQAIDMYERNDIISLNNIPTLYVAEVRVATAIDMNPEIGEFELIQENLDIALKMVDETLVGVEFDSDKIIMNFKMVLVENIMSHRRMIKLSNRDIEVNLTDNEIEGIEYAEATSNKDIKDIDSKYQSKYVIELGAILDIFNLDLNDYEKWGNTGKFSN